MLGFGAPEISITLHRHYFLPERTVHVKETKFGSGFAFCPRPLNNGQINIDNIATNSEWPGWLGKFKTNTALEYDSNWNVTNWGYPAISQRPNLKTKGGSQISDKKPVELFKLHLGDIPVDEKPLLPTGLNYKKAITDYLREMGKIIKERLGRNWPHLDFHNDVQIVMTIPAEFIENTKAIMRKCAFDAGLINKKDSENLTFTTEPEAAALYCLHYVHDYQLGDCEHYMIVDCGGGTVDLTTRKLLPGKQIGEVTVRTGGYCGSAYVDRQGILKILDETNWVKILFTGDPKDYRRKILDIEEYCPAAIQYINYLMRPKLEENQWRIFLDFDTVKSMFEPVINSIINLIQKQIDASPAKCQVIFLCGGFGESPYLLKRVKERFETPSTMICAPHQAVTAIVRGAVLVGINESSIKTRVLKWTYGIECYRRWDPTRDPIERRGPNGYVRSFDKLATRGEKVNVNKEYKKKYSTTHPTTVSFPVYTSSNENEVYCDGLKRLGELEIAIPNPQGLKRDIEFSLFFGQMDIKAMARILETNLQCITTLMFDQD
ncbi:7747_t:CDS:10 [Ambispora leptoticha]|uniref:7747_t:CDS:1 n=1 Tax=Ambispora leptoticha TaxID=144679 RepID=A0A9N8VZF0_9GLOM|nr:7747_t:CDS:10 [Ambispora leptoticha]